MKKLIGILCVLTMVIGITGCSSGGSTNTGGATDEMALTEIMSSILDGVELPAVGEVELNQDNFGAFAFIDYKDGYEGLASEAMIGSIAHSVVLLRGENEAMTKEMAEAMEGNVDPRKWICVEAEKVVITQKGNTALLVMSSEATTDAIVANFEAIS